MKRYRSKKKVLFRLLMVRDDGTLHIVRDNKRGQKVLKEWLNYDVSDILTAVSAMHGESLGDTDESN